MFYVFHGEDEFSQAEELAGLRGMLAGGDPAMADLNTSILDGSQLSLGELRHACDSMPFMADRRLVIVHGLLSRLRSSRKAREQESSADQPPDREDTFLEDLAAYLPTLPPSTRLIFIEQQSLPPSHPILRVAREEGKRKRGFVRLFKQPQEGRLPGWIQKRVQDKGGSISREAITLLAALVGRDLRLLDQEIHKLLLYSDGQRVTAEDVQVLVSRARETSIFDLVDCVGRRQTDKALQLVHRLLDDGEAPLYLLAMLARQIRILIQVSELKAQGLTQQQITDRLKLHSYVVEKGLVQARNFDMAQLEAAHQRLVDADWSIKTGEMEDVLALDLLVTDLTRS